MSNILLDTNVVLDVLLDRHPHAQASTAVWAAIENGSAVGMLSAHAVTTIHYLVRKELGLVRAKQIIASLLTVFAVAAVDSQVLKLALDLPFSDFEDAVTAAAAQCSGCDYLLTRDPKGFHQSPVRCLTPEAALALLPSKLH